MPQLDRLLSSCPASRPGSSDPATGKKCRHGSDLASRFAAITMSHGRDSVVPTGRDGLGRDAAHGRERPREGGVTSGPARLDGGPPRATATRTQGASGRGPIVQASVGNRVHVAKSFRGLSAEIFTMC